MGSMGRVSMSSADGGVGPARYTEDRKPARWRAVARCMLDLEDRNEVRPRRALEAFWRCEHMSTSVLNDMLGVCVWVFVVDVCVDVVVV